MQEYKILAISYAYAPSNWPRSIQLSRLLPTLSESAGKILLITNHVEVDDPRFDETLVNVGTNKNIEVIRLSLPFYLKFISKIIKIIPFLRSIPDEEIVWGIYVAFFIRSKFAGKVIANLITFSNPLSDHIVGLINRKKTLNWIVHFSDPWTLNIYKRRKFFVNKINQYLEQRVFDLANHIIFVSEQTKQAYSEVFMGKYDTKMDVIRHVKPDLVYGTATNEEYVKFAHFGSIYGLRDPTIIFRMLKELKSQFLPQDKKRIVFEFYGADGKNYDKILEELDISDFVNFHKGIPYQEALRKMAGANCLVLLDANSLDGNVFIASKLVDYWAFMHTPILAFTPKNSATHELLMSYDQEVFDYASSDRLLEFVMSIVSDTIDLKRPASWKDAFSVNEAVKKFNFILR